MPAQLYNYLLELLPSYQENFFVVSDLPKAPDTFQDLIARLQEYWAIKGCVIMQPPGYGSRCRHVSSCNVLKGYWSRDLEQRLCSALASADGWSIWRKPKSFTALLSVPSSHEAVPKRFSRALPRVSARSRN